MTASKLLDRFELITDAPETIPRLRRLIVDLAVRGRLIQKGNNDEPASELLKRIQAKSITVVTKAKHGSGDNRPITDDEIPFPVSSGKEIRESRKRVRDSIRW
jgi:type I restriction enzyme, S subunit